MTNLEKYKDDLMKIEGCFAFNKNTKKITRCDASMNCRDCLIGAGDCYESDKIKWLYEEYKEPILSDNELKLIKALNKATGKEWKFIGRNKIGEVILFTDEPLIQNNAFGIYFKKEKGYCLYMNGNYLFSNIAYDAGGCGLYDIENKVYHKYK
jgi:hypothetical protein